MSLPRPSTRSFSKTPHSTGRKGVKFRPVVTLLAAYTRGRHVLDRGAMFAPTSSGRLWRGRRIRSAARHDLRGTSPGQVLTYPW